MKKHLRDAPVLVHRFDLFLSLAGAGHFGPHVKEMLNAGSMAAMTLLILDQLSECLCLSNCNVYSERI